MIRVGRYLLALTVLLLAKSTLAEVFCVDSAQAIQTALTTAASNGQDDEIKIVQGTYVGNFVYATATEAYDLALEGGYTAGCSSQTINPANTILDGVVPLSLGLLSKVCYPDIFGISFILTCTAPLATRITWSKTDSTHSTSKFTVARIADDSSYRIL